MGYRFRLIDDVVQKRLKIAGAVVLEGPRACGKTATGLKHSQSSVFLDTDENAQSLYKVDPERLLQGEKPRLLDEWQTAPGLWNRVRRHVDQAGFEDGRKGQFILTGSAVPIDDVIRHSGAGRFSRISMRTMSTAERPIGSRRVSLGSIMGFNHSAGSQQDVTGESQANLDTWVSEILTGGWPALFDSSIEAASQYVRDYVGDTANVDVGRLESSGVDPVRVRALLNAMARNNASDVNLKTLAADAQIHRETVSNYLATLTRIHVYEPQPSWGPHLRSRSRLRSAPKLHFVDPSIAVAAIGANREDLLADVGFVGSLFESLVVRDLRVYSDHLGFEVLKHYRDSNGLEADAIIDAGYRKWAAVEVKLASRSEVVDQAANNLIRLSERVDTDKTGPPAALIVITGSGYAYTRPDGVHVIPLDLLGP